MTKSVNPFDKIDNLKRLAKIIFPQISDKEFNSSIESIYRCYIKEKKREKLSEIDKGIIRVLEKENIKPSTARWYLSAYRLPTNLKTKLRNGSIGLSSALKINSNLRIKGDQAIKNEIVNDLRKYAKDLRENEFIDRVKDSLRRGY